MKKHDSLLGTGGSIIVDKCQLCGAAGMDSVLFVGYLPPVNTMPPLGESPSAQQFFPAEMLHCRQCHLAQLGCIVDAKILFPDDYAYTSGTTRILRENFADLYREVMERLPLTAQDLVVDIGSNDGTLLSNFQKGGHRVCGIEPTDVHRLGIEKGIPAVHDFFGPDSVRKVTDQFGQAKVVTATNVFAHIEDVHQVVESVLGLLAPKGLFITESHYLLPLVETLQYDTIYHEHLRYYSLASLGYLLDRHGLEVVHAKRIPTHGGSIRVYAARKGEHSVSREAAALKADEDARLQGDAFKVFKRRVAQSKLDLLELFAQLRRKGKRIYAIGAPSRASTLAHYVGLDESMLECVCEIKGSIKIGRYMPGKRIPVVDEAKLFSDPPDYALLFSWHIADELVTKIKGAGFRGKFIIPLPEPRIVE